MPPAINAEEFDQECPGFPEWQQRTGQETYGPRLDEGKEPTPVRILNTPWHHPQAPKFTPNRIGIANFPFRFTTAQLSTSAIQIMPNGIYDTIEITAADEPGGSGAFFPIYVELGARQNTQGIFVVKSTGIVDSEMNKMFGSPAADQDFNKLIINVCPTDAPFVVWTWDQSLANPVVGTFTRNISINLISQNR